LQPSRVRQHKTNGRTDARAFSLEELAARVREFVREPAAARFGRDKVFIAWLVERTQTVPELRALGEAVFKERLVAAHRAGLLSLSRADLTSAMSPDLVSRSAVTYMNAVFHFVNLDEVSP
jgi:hypothetical protein